VGGQAGRGRRAGGGLHAGSKLQGNCETLMTAAAVGEVKARAGKKPACLAERRTVLPTGQWRCRRAVKRRCRPGCGAAVPAWLGFSAHFATYFLLVSWCKWKLFCREMLTININSFYSPRYFLYMVA
jgi:hypothetical protein